MYESIKEIKHICFICLKIVEDDKNCQKVSTHTFGVAKQYSSSYANINLRKELHSRLETAVFAEGMISHKSCYSTLTNKKALEKSIASFMRDQGELPKCVFCLGDENVSVICTEDKSNKMYAILTDTKIRRVREILPVGDFFERLGETKAKALIGWYTFQATDNTGSFAGKGIITHFNTFMDVDTDILEAFTEFGEENTISEFVFKQMERYVCQLYRKTFEGSISDLRYLLASEGKEGSQLPPTVGTLKPHIQRAFYMSRVWKSSVTSSPEVISPSDFGWYADENGEYRPIICTKASAPKALLELKHCSCRSGNDRCRTNRCGCFKHNLECTDLCKCGDELCKNRLDEDKISDTEDITNLI